jgi:hypothetical protein
MRKFLLLFLISCYHSLYAQDLNWWQNNVNWDGTTHWYKYLIISPKYFGPNALSVPAINNGSADTIISLAATGNFHFSKGDNTQNIMLYGNYTTKNNTISVDAQFVPYERFQVSHEKKTERKVYYKNYYDKEVVGDVVVNTTIQLFQRWRENFQLAMRVGVRMPSGGGQGSARYADVPGYWIDFGGAIPFKNPEWKWMTMIGFLVWQTNQDALRQDDAFLFGSGFEWNHNDLRLQAYGAGFLGYKNNGDKPIVLRLNFEKRKNRNVFLFRMQQGVRDFSYFTIEAGFKYLFPK